MLRALIDFLLPTTSLTGTPGTLLTDKERRQIERHLHPLRLSKESLQKKNMHALDDLVAASGYDSNPLLSHLIIRMKYGRLRGLSIDIARWMHETSTGLLVPPLHIGTTTPTLAAVPLHWTREYWRGFNQARCIAVCFATLRGWPVADLLTRTRPTGHQTKRSRAERLKALEDAFAYNNACASEEVPPWVVLIDDVCTTGATLQACAKVLKSVGVKHVTGFVVASE